MTEGQRVRLVRLTASACPELEAMLGAEGVVEAVAVPERPPRLLVYFDGNPDGWWLRENEVEAVE